MPAIMDEPPLERPEILLALHRKRSKKIESGRGIMLSADELNVRLERVAGIEPA